MLYKTLTNLSLKASGFTVALLVFLCSHQAANAQGLYAYENLGPASFSANWGATQGSNPDQPEEIQQRSYHSRTFSEPSMQDNFASAPELPGHANAGPTVPGRRAVLRHGIAYAPEEAPLPVKRAIWAIDTINKKPYVWGGGHDSFFDPRGYDCSGTVSFALHYAGQLGAPTDSRGMMGFGMPGPGRWMTIFARNGHTWMIIAGLRLDTSDLIGHDDGPRWRADSRTSWGFVERHPVGL